MARRIRHIFAPSTASRWEEFVIGSIIGGTLLGIGFAFGGIIVEYFRHKHAFQGRGDGDDGYADDSGSGWITYDRESFCGFCFRNGKPVSQECAKQCGSGPWNQTSSSPTNATAQLGVLRRW